MQRKDKVSCVILAGGFGTRLSPLTDIKPKPLIKILDTPVLESILCAVNKAGVDRITVSTHFHSETIERYCREKHPEISCKKECVPLGTAGGVKFCTDASEETVLVVSGDAVFDFSLKEVLDFHKQNGCDVTIVTSRKENPTPYGTVVTDEQNSILEFCEKPSWKRVRSALVNTGIYVLSKRALCSIPDNMVYDFSNNLFPKLLKEGANIKSFTANGFWCDMGCFSEYCACNGYAAKGKLSCIPNKGKSVDSLVETGIHAEDGVYVSHSAIIGKNVRLSEGSIVCDNTHIADNCDICSSVIGEGSRVGEGSSISRAIIGEECAVGENCIIPEGCVIGDKCRISDGTVLKMGKKIPAHTAVFARGGRGMFFNGENIFADDGICVFDMENVHENILRLSCAVSAAYAQSEKMGAAVGVMYAKDALHIKNTFVSGLQGKGVYVFDCGVGNEAMCAYSAARFDWDVSVYFDIRNGNTHVTFFGTDGRKIEDGDERKISKVFGLTQNFSDNMAERNMPCFNPSIVPLSQMYTLSLSRFARRLDGKVFDKTAVFLSSHDGADNASVTVLSAVLCAMGVSLSDQSGKEIINISLSSDGTRASIRYGNTVLDHEHICAAVMKNKEILGIEDVFAGENAPAALRSLQNKNAEFSPYRQENFIFSDGAFAVAAFLSAVSLRGDMPDVISGEVAPFEIFRDEYVGDVNRGETVERLSRLYHDSKDGDGDGIRLSLADGNVTVIPSRAKGFKIISEAHSMEAARELSVKIGDIIKGKK